MGIIKWWSFNISHSEILFSFFLGVCVCVGVGGLVVWNPILYLKLLTGETILGSKMNGNVVSCMIFIELVLHSFPGSEGMLNLSCSCKFILLQIVP